MHVRRFAAKYPKRAIIRAATRVASGVLALGLVRAAPMAAANEYWDGDGVGPVGGGSGYWDLSLPRWGPTPASTSFSPFVNSGDTAVFGGTGGPVILGATLNADLDVQSNGYLLEIPAGSANSFTWNSVANVNVAAGAAAEMRMASPNGASTSFTKTGGGTFAFTFGLERGGGAVTVSDGTLQYARYGATVGSSIGVTVLAPGTLHLGKFYDTIGALSGSGTIVLGTINDATNVIPTTGGPPPNSVWGSTLFTTTGTDTTFAGRITDDGGSLVGAPFSGGHFIKNGTGTLTLTGSANDFRGTILMNQGRIVAATTGALPSSSPFILGGGTLALGASQTIGSLANYNADLNTDSGAPWMVDVEANTLTIGTDNLVNQYDALLGGSGTIVKVGSGKQYINSTQTGSTFTGKYVVHGGTLGFTSVSRLGVEPTAVVPDYFTLDNGGTIANATGVVLTANNWGISANRGITLGAGGGGISYDNPSSVGVAINAPISGSGTLVRSGQGFLNFQGNASNFSGDWVFTGGISNFGSAPASSLFNTVGLGTIPAGTGSWDVTAARVQLATNDALPGGQQSYTIASKPGGTFSFGPGVVVGLGHTGQTLVTITVGDAAASSSTLIRKPNGTMFLNVLSGSNDLGTSTGEHFYFNGGVATVSTNGGSGTLVPGVFIADSDLAIETQFATYDNANGFHVAPTSSKIDINLANATDVFAATTSTNNTLPAGGSASVYALKVGNAQGFATNVALAGGTLSINPGGPATDPAVVLMNANAIVGGGTLDFGNHEAVIAGFGGSFAGAVIATSQGMTKIGYRTLTLDSATTLNYPGPTRIEQGQLILNADHQLPATTDLIFCGAPSTNANADPTLVLNGKNIIVNSINTTGPGTPIVNLGSGGVLKVTGSNTSSAFDGQVTGGSSGATSTIWNAGSGALTLGIPDAVQSHRSTAMTYNKLWNTGGGTVVLPTSNDFNVYPLANTGIVPDSFYLDNGSTFRFAGTNGVLIGGSTSGFPSLALTINNSRRGFRIGPGGGTIRVDNPYLQLSLAGDGGVNCSGTITKTGPGILVLPTTITGRIPQLNIQGGVVTISNDNVFGGSPTALRSDAIVLDNGGALDLNAPGSIIPLSTNRGITVGAGGGVLRQQAGSLEVSTLTGSGPLRIAGAGNSPGVHHGFLASSDGTAPGASAPYTGTVTIATEQPVYANAKNALGLGTITNDPAYAVTFGTNSGVTFNSILANPFLIHGGGRTWDWSNTNVSVTLTLSGQISGDGIMYKGLVASSLGPIALSNSANDFTGQLVIQSGSLIPQVNGSLGSTSTPLIINGGNLLLNNSAEVNYTSPKPLRLSGAAITNSSTNKTFAGAITLTSSTTINVQSGTLTLTGNLVGANDAILTSPTGGLTLKNIRTGGLTLPTGTDHLAASGGALASVSNIRTITLGGAAKLDLGDNKLVTANPAGTWNATAYTGVTGLVASGRNGDTQPLWDGVGGIITTVPIAQTSNYTTIGVARASDVIRSAATSTAIWAGQTISGADTLVIYTYGGDATLDGKINIDDYVRIDIGLVLGLTGWSNGDFNYDGKINIDDYTQFIDPNIGTQGPPFSTGGGLDGLSVVAVPEPAMGGWVVAAVMVAAHRRRRRQ